MRTLCVVFFLHEGLTIHVFLRFSNSEVKAIQSVIFKRLNIDQAFHSVSAPDFTV